jgi:hypothetical protein
MPVLLVAVSVAIDASVSARKVGGAAELAPLFGFDAALDPDGQRHVHGIGTQQQPTRRFCQIADHLTHLVRLFHIAHHDAE